MSAVDPAGRIRHPLDVFHSTFNPDGTDVPAGYIAAADGTGLVQYVDPATLASTLTVKDEGTPLATAATSIDFVGAGVTASGTGAAKTVTISGGSTTLAGLTGDVTLTSPVLADRLRFDGTVWRNSALFWQVLTDPGIPDVIYDTGTGDLIYAEA